MNSSRFSVSEGDGPLGGYVLHDADSESTARVLPEVGANCAELRLRGGTGPLLDVLYAPETLDKLRASPARSGVPLLFPFPNRIRDARFTLAGKTYQLRPNSRGNAIHGLVIDQPFRVTLAEGAADGARIRCVITDADLAVKEGYPFPFQFQAEYVLRERTLTLAVQATNTGSEQMPFGFGIHPYFRTPLGSSGSRARCQVAVPVTSRWELDASLVPTGRRVPLTPEESLTSLTPLDERTFDTVYGDVQLDGGWSRCRLVDPDAHAELTVAADDHFREIVVYTPPGHQSISFEPYTCTTNAFNLQEQAVDAGRLLLAPGSTWSATIRMGLTAIG